LLLMLASNLYRPSIAHSAKQLDFAGHTWTGLGARK